MIIGASQKRNHTFSPHSASQRTWTPKENELPFLKTSPFLKKYPFLLLCFLLHRFNDSHHSWLRKAVDDTLCASDGWGNLYKAYGMFDTKIRKSTMVRPSLVRCNTQDTIRCEFIHNNVIESMWSRTPLSVPMSSGSGAYTHWGEDRTVVEVGTPFHDIVRWTNGWR